MFASTDGRNGISGTDPHAVGRLVIVVDRRLVGGNPGHKKLGVETADVDRRRDPVRVVHERVERQAQTLCLDDFAQRSPTGIQLGAVNLESIVIGTSGERYRAASRVARQQDARLFEQLTSGCQVKRQRGITARHLAASSPPRRCRRTSLRLRSRRPVDTSAWKHMRAGHERDSARPRCTRKDFEASGGVAEHLRRSPLGWMGVANKETLARQSLVASRQPPSPQSPVPSPQSPVPSPEKS